MSARLFAAIVFVAAASAPSTAATFGELSANRNGAPMPLYPSGAYAPAPMQAYPPSAYAPPPPAFGGPEGVDPDGWANGPTYWDAPTPLTAPRLYLPMQNGGDLPHGQLRLWSFGQMNSMTDPFNPWGLSTPDMFVPWSTPLSGWANAQTWNWWRERSGALPRNW